jgi:polyisoprenoid-binding protein YceI
VDAAHSSARFHLRALGVPVLRGTLPVSSGEMIIDGANGIRTANFQLDALGMVFDAHTLHVDPRGLFGTAAQPRIEFETQWAREGGLDHHELDGVLRLHGYEHVFSLRAERGSWEPVATESYWFRGILHGALNRKAWEVRAHTLADAGLLLLGHDVEFEVSLTAGPRISPPDEQAHDGTIAAAAGEAPPAGNASTSSAN